MKKRLLIGLLVIALGCSAGCQSVTEDMPDNSSLESYVNLEEDVSVENSLEASENFGPEYAFLISDIQKERFPEEYLAVCEAVVEAVLASEETVDLSGLTEYSIVRDNSLLLAREVHPLVQLATFTEIDKPSGIYEISYGCTAQEHEKIVQEFQEKVQGIVQECMEKATTKEEYAKAVFDYMVEHCRYDYDTYYAVMEAGYYTNEAVERYNSLSAYNVLMRGDGECLQFAQSYTFLMRSVGIECMCVTGQSAVLFRSNNAHYAALTEGQLFGDSHAWNAIKLNGKWYGVDTTFAITAAQDANASQEEVNHYFGMGETTDAEHFCSENDRVDYGHNITDIQRASEDLYPYNEAARELPEGFDDSWKAKKISVGNYTLEKGDENAKDRAGGSISFAGSGNEYSYTLYFPEGNRNQLSEERSVCYYLGTPEKIDETKVTVCIEGKNPEQLFATPVSFINELCGTIIPTLEQEYALGGKERELAGAGDMANLVLFTFCQSDGVAKDIFGKYEAVVSSLEKRLSRKTVVFYEAWFFERSKEAPAELTIRLESGTSAGNSATILRLAEVIKKREYRQLAFEYVTSQAEG